MGTHPINVIKKGRWTIFYVQFSLRPKWVKKRSFQHLDGQHIIFKGDSIPYFPNCPKNAKMTRSSNCLTFFSHKESIPTQEGFPNRRRKHPRHSKKSEEHLPQCPWLFTMEKEVVNGFLIRLTKITSIC